MRVDWAIPCRYVEVNDGLATIVGAGIDTYYPAELPAQIDATVAVRIIGTPTGRQHFAAVILNPEFEEVSRLEGDMSMQVNPNLPAGWESQSILATMHRFTVTEEGAYTLSITVDDSPAHTIPLTIRLAPTPPPA